MSNDFVRKGYEKAADDYLSKRDQFKNDKYLEKFNLLLSPGSLILDLGCGAGKPIDEFFIKHGHRVIGIDISQKQIELAKRNVPEGEFKVEDMSDLKIGEYPVDAVVSFYAVFHIRREEHKGLFEKIYSFLPFGGFILVTMGSSEWEGLEKDFHGTGMFWSHFGADKNRKIIEDSGFSILLSEIDESGGERHQIIIAKKT